MPIVLTPPFENLTFMSALSDARAAALVHFLSTDLHGTVVDIGCGWAELLLRIVAATPDGLGIGIDTDEALLEHGRQLARERGLQERTRLSCEDARVSSLDSADAVVCIGASQVWGPPVEANEPIAYSAALTALRAMVPRGGRVVYGEGIWSTPPTAAAAAPLSGRLDELVPLCDLVDLAAGHGFAPVAVHEASLDEWDVFESGYSACYARWLAEHDPNDPDATEVRSRAERQRNAYFKGYRGTLGMAYLALVAI